MKQSKYPSVRGQAVLEYVIILVLVAMIGIQFMKSSAATMGKTMGSLATRLSDELTTGTCAKNCFIGNYQNGRRP